MGKHRLDIIIQFTFVLIMKMCVFNVSNRCDLLYSGDYRDAISEIYNIQFLELPAGWSTTACPMQSWKQILLRCDDSTKETTSRGVRMTGLNTVDLQHSVFTRGALISCFLLLETCFAPAAQSGLQTLGRFWVMGELAGCLDGNSGSKWCRSNQKSSCLMGQVTGWQCRSRSSRMVSTWIMARGHCELRPLSK